jgi:glutathione S-transferase
MKLYYSKGACSLAVRIALYEMEIPCEFEAVNLKTKQTEKDVNFLTINPKGSVPALLLDNQEVLTENAVIQQYLADNHVASSLLPIAGLRRFRILEWLNFISTDLHKACSPLFNAKVPDEIKQEIFQPILKNKLSFVETHLKDNQYLMGELFSLADDYLFVVLVWLPGLHISLSDYPHLQRYFSLVKQRPMVQKALRDEGIHLK